MSEYRRYQYRHNNLSVSQAELARRAGLGDVVRSLADGAASAFESASNLSDRFRKRVEEFEGDGLDGATARCRALDEAPLLADAVRSELGRRSLDAFTDNASGPDDARLDAALVAAEERLLDAEMHLLGARLRDSIAELGYTIEPLRRQPAEGVRVHGSRDDGTGVTAQLSPRSGALKIDLSGFRDGSCIRERERLEGALRRGGVRLQVTDAELHRRVEGGPLAQQALGELGEARGTPAPNRASRRRNRT